MLEIKAKLADIGLGNFADANAKQTQFFVARPMFIQQELGDFVDGFGIIYAHFEGALASVGGKVCPANFYGDGVGNKAVFLQGLGNFGAHFLQLHLQNGGVIYVGVESPFLTDAFGQTVIGVDGTAVYALCSLLQLFRLVPHNWPQNR